MRFRIYSHDHLPRHAHGLYGATLLVVEFDDSGEIAVRRGSIEPKNAKRSEVRKIVDAAEEHIAELIKMWEATHGKAGR